jgi:hypothetical protein
MWFERAQLSCEARLDARIFESLLQTRELPRLVRNAEPENARVADRREYARPLDCYFEKSEIRDGALRRARKLSETFQLKLAQKLQSYVKLPCPLQIQANVREFVGQPRRVIGDSRLDVLGQINRAENAPLRLRLKWYVVQHEWCEI